MNLLVKMLNLYDGIDYDNDDDDDDDSIDI